MISETTQTPMMPDAYLEYWSDVYIRRDLYWRGIPLLAFLRDPGPYLQHESQHLPLLPRQQEVQQRLDVEAEAAERELERDCPDLTCRGGQLVEPMHHHAHIPRNARAHFRGKGGSHE